MSAYEAAIALPFALVLGDLCFPDGEGNHTLRLRWGPRLAALAVAAAYLPFAATIRHGLVTPDTTHLRPLAEVARALRFDSVAYALKALGVFNPLEPTSYWLQRTAGEPIAWVVCLAAAVVFGMARGLRLGMRPLGWFGLATFALFLAPPLLTRASVSIWNLPTLRQLYLPVLLGGPLLMAAWLQSGSASPSAGRRLRAVAAFAWLALLAVQSALSTGHFGSEGDAAGVARVTAALLDGVPPNATVVGIGEETCRFAPSLIRGGPSILAVPAGRDEADPELDAVGQHTVIARASNGFDIPAREEPPERAPGPGPGPSWITLRPPQLLGTGSQRIPGATVTVAQRDGERITSLRYDFDSPLEDLVFLRFHGCERPTREVVRPADGLP